MENGPENEAMNGNDNNDLGMIEDVDEENNEGLNQVCVF